MSCRRISGNHWPIWYGRVQKPDARGTGARCGGRGDECDHVCCAGARLLSLGHQHNPALRATLPIKKTPAAMERRNYTGERGDAKCW
ncbi:hypothetical protein CUMW_259310 [Citrus unshiu]|uniref:Uncharacterized protein n=1 Tax=Citrus unshiu TaxID=55188 RepID=A0A2H5QT43_CITUN|nr:hypothetical protein CUMW_259310 [Citrus unshiu]